MFIAVYCASSNDIDDVYLEFGEEVGRKIARKGHAIVYGGGNNGLMGRVSKGAREEGGLVVGVILDKFVEMGLADREISELVIKKDMRERKKGIEERADAHLFLPGGIGTLDEFFELLSLKFIGENSNPYVLLNFRDYFHGLLNMFERMEEERFLPIDRSELFFVTASVDTAMDYMENHGG